jgi:hypothetical protein
MTFGHLAPPCRRQLEDGKLPMTTTTQVPEPKLLNPWRISGWGSAGALLVVPALAGWPWPRSGFALAATMLAAIGVIIELGVRRARNITQKAAFAIAVVTWFILLWIGFIRSADDPMPTSFTWLR